MSSKASLSEPLRVVIGPVVERAQAVSRIVQEQLPGHKDLARIADGVATAAAVAERVSRQMRRVFSPHRLPAAFLVLALLGLGIWIYWRFFFVTTLTIALPDRDAAQIREHVAGLERVDFEPVMVPGSRESVAHVAAGEVDLAFVQGGIEIPADMLRLETPSPELVLWFLRDGIAGPHQVHRILTSVANEGSHSVAKLFLAAWQCADGVEFVHEWRQLTASAEYKVPAGIDAAFIVKDPADEKTLAGAQRLAAAGFRLRSPDIGARSARLDFLGPATLPRGYLQADPAVPGEVVSTYSVKTFLVARRGLTPRLLAQAGRVLDPKPNTITSEEFDPSRTSPGDIFQGIDAFLGILVYLGLAFLTLLGLDVMTYRRRFHELNSFISLLSMLQSDKDVLGIAGARERADNLLYLGLCSDLLGLISMISNYYTQENSTLLFNKLPEVIHQRCDGLKINIQLKILHATVEMPETAAESIEPPTASPPRSDTDPSPCG